jgi:hypothetical protein
VSFVVHKTTLELECVILTTMYLVSAKNTDSWRARKGDLQRFSSRHFDGYFTESLLHCEQQ